MPQALSFLLVSNNIKKNIAMEIKKNSTFQIMNQDFIKLDWFNRCNFTWWKDKMVFLLIALKIYYILDPKLPHIEVQLHLQIQVQKTFSGWRLKGKGIRKIKVQNLEAC